MVRLWLKCGENVAVKDFYVRDAARHRRRQIAIGIGLTAEYAGKNGHQSTKDQGIERAPQGKCRVRHL